MIMAMVVLFSFFFNISCLLYLVYICKIKFFKKRVKKKKKRKETIGWVSVVFKVVAWRRELVQRGRRRVVRQRRP